jgi:hypothetical protein
MASSRGNGRSPAPHDRVIARNITLSLSRGSISLKPSHVEQLVGSLRQLSSSHGNAVADEIGDLLLAGVRVDLRLSAGELDALASAVISLTSPLRTTDPAFARLLAYVREEEAR